MRLDRLPLRPEITVKGQPYVDEPIYREIKPKPIGQAVAAAFGSFLRPIEILDHYEHTRLNWRTPPGARP